jgi:hypothetical protein
MIDIIVTGAFVIILASIAIVCAAGAIWALFHTIYGIMDWLS